MKSQKIMITKNNDIHLPKKMTQITENDVMPNNKKMMFLCLKNCHESQKMTLLKKNNIPLP